MPGTLISWTLEGEYLIHGNVTGFDYEPLPGVRVMVRNLRTSETGAAVVEEDGTYRVDLRDGLTRDVVGVRVNGEPLPAGAWKFRRPLTVTFAAGVSSSDILEVERATYYSIEDVKHLLVEEGEPQVRNATARWYPSPFPRRVPELQEISESLTAARMRDERFSGADSQDEDAKALRVTAGRRLKELETGKRSLTDVYGEFVAPQAKDVTTARSSITPRRQFTRWTDDNPRVDL